MIDYDVIMSMHATIINAQDVVQLHGPLVSLRLNGLLTGRINEIFKAQFAHQICPSYKKEESI